MTAAQKLIRRLRSALRSNGRVTFWGYVGVPEATGPQTFKCQLRGFNNLGGCRGVITIQ